MPISAAHPGLRRFAVNARGRLLTASPDLQRVRPLVSRGNRARRWHIHLPSSIGGVVSKSASQSAGIGVVASTNSVTTSSAVPIPTFEATVAADTRRLYALRCRSSGMRARPRIPFTKPCSRRGARGRRCRAPTTCRDGSPISASTTASAGGGFSDRRAGHSSSCSREPV